jgi:DNA-binding NtrC family response regulator
VPHTTRTQDDEAPPSSDRAPRPGIVVVWSGGRPSLAAHPLDRGELVIGRDPARGVAVVDEHMSREHSVISFGGGRFTLRDLASRNGTFVDGVRTDRTEVEGVHVVRTGHTLALTMADIDPFVGAAVELRDGMVIGPSSRLVLEHVAQAARTAETLLLTGESGAGKELAARTFHTAGPHSGGPFVAVNCAAIPEGVAERLLFGARRGAYSGATADAEGYLQSAEQGTLFLDELAELDLAVQAKLLRAIETRQVLPLGASKPRPVRVRFCTATNADLRAEVAADRFRQDLYFRISRPEVSVPPLRARLEEMPWLIDEALRRARPDMRAHVRLVENCLLRPWPGNVRELMAEIERAGHGAIAAGRTVATAADLADTAGTAFAVEPAANRRGPESVEPAEVEDALRRARGNVSAAARALGLHRTQLRRLLERHGIKGVEG